MAHFVFNAAKGRFVHYATLPATNDAWIVVLLKTAGLEADATLKDKTTLAAILAASSDEATFTNYARQTLTGVTQVVDNTNERNDVTSDGWQFANAGGADNTPVSKTIICYDPDTTGGTDSDLIPLFGIDTVFTPDGTTQAFTVPSPGFARAGE